VLAAANLYSFIGILAASGAFYLLKHYLQLGPAAIFFWASILTLARLLSTLAPPDSSFGCCFGLPPTRFTASI